MKVFLESIINKNTTDTKKTLETQKYFHKKTFSIILKTITNQRLRLLVLSLLMSNHA